MKLMFRLVTGKLYSSHKDRNWAAILLFYKGCQWCTEQVPFNSYVSPIAHTTYKKSYVDGKFRWVLTR